jgi:hypothetical protein
MWTAVLKMDYRKAFVFYAPCLATACCYALFLPRPLYSDDATMALIGAAQGVLLAFGIFRDPTNTQPFLFSRPLSRGKLFLSRWGLGIGFQIVTLAIVLALLALGCRGWFQRTYAWSAMVKWYELSVLWPLGLASLVCYQVAMAGYLIRKVLVQERAVTSRVPTRPQRKGGPVLLILVLGLASGAAILLVSLATIRCGIGHLLPAWAARAAIAYIVIIAVLTTASALHCFHRLEIEA